MTIRSLHPGLNQTAGIGLNMFSQDELEKVHLATLDLLWNVGVKIESPQAVEIFHGSGCSVGKDNITVKIPAHLVEDAIRACPPTFRACGRDTSKDFVCERDRVGFVNFGEAPRMIDPETRTMRKPTRKDVDQATRFLDCLDQIAVFERPLTPADVAQDISCLYNGKSYFENCTKHGYIGINSVKNLRVCYEMVRMIVKAVKGMPINDDLMALDVIESVGPGGEYITHRHTYENMKQQSQVDLFNRKTRETWEASGAKNIVDASYEKALDIINNHVPDPLPDSVQASLNEIFAEAEEIHERRKK